MRISALVAASALCLTFGDVARADDIFVSFEGRNSSQNMGPLAAADSMTIVGQIKRPDGAVDNSVAFKPLTSSLTISTSWRSGSVGDVFRLIGVNVDLLDAAGAVVASDAFQGVLGGFAISSMTAAVTSGQVYRIRLTGTSLGVAAYTILIAPG